MKKTKDKKDELRLYLPFNKLPVEDRLFEMDRETLVRALTDRLREIDHDLKVDDCPSCGDNRWSVDPWTDDCSCRVCGLLYDIAKDVWSAVEREKAE